MAANFLKKVNFFGKKVKNFHKKVKRNKGTPLSKKLATALNLSCGSLLDIHSTHLLVCIFCKYIYMFQCSLNYIIKQWFTLHMKVLKASRSPYKQTPNPIRFEDCFPRAV